MQPDPHQALLERARAGDEQALEQLLEAHQAQVYRFGMKMCRDPEDAKDVLQETLLAMARSVRDFRGASSISTWLYTVARSFCIKKRRRSKFAPEREHSLGADVGTAAELAGGPRMPDETLAGKEVEQVLQQAIDTLDPMYREVLILRDAEGLTAPEVAEVLGVSIEAVKSRLHRARLAVRAKVAPVLGVRDTKPAIGGACPDVLTLFSRHLDHEISGDACAEMERHLNSCDRCRQACDSLKQTLALCRAAGASAELPESIRASVKVALRDLLASRS
jgi:RNA polymerase sigma-70 factor, ECF subfamily